MYHDQGEIALKLMVFDQGVTVKGGLPVPIAIPAHGTAYEYVGLNKANLGPSERALAIAVRLGTLTAALTRTSHRAGPCGADRRNSAPIGPETPPPERNDNEVTRTMHRRDGDGRPASRRLHPRRPGTRGRYRRERRIPPFGHRQDGRRHGSWWRERQGHARHVRSGQ